MGNFLPRQFKDVLVNFSRKVEFFYQIEEKVPEEFKNIFAGGISWDLEKIPELLNNYKGWVEASLDPSYNNVSSIEITNRIYPNKTPFLEVDNGDLIIIDNSGNNQVNYLDHEGGKMHGRRLGESFIDFLDKWSELGFIGSEGWQLEVLYDKNAEGMMSSKDLKVLRWNEWLKY